MILKNVKTFPILCQLLYQMYKRDVINMFIRHEVCECYWKVIMIFKVSTLKCIRLETKMKSLMKCKYNYKLFRLTLLGFAGLPV